MVDAVHPDDEIQLLLDGRLQGGALSHVEAHLAACPDCRRRRDLLAEARRLARSLGTPSLPPGIETRLRATLDEEDAAQRSHGGHRRWMAAVFAVVAIVVLALLVRPLWTPEDPVAVAADDLAALQRGRLPLEVATDEPPQLASYFAEKGVPSTVYDLTAAGFRLEGGRAHVLAGRPSALSAYRGPDGRSLYCQMYHGRTADLPAGASMRERGGVAFRLYARDGVSLAFWQEGTVVCVLVSELSAERLLDLAAAKATQGA